jgi:hypothetical protein
VGIGTGYELDDWGSIPDGGAGNFFLLHRIQTGSRTHPASCPMDTGSLSPGVKRPERET